MLDQWPVAELSSPPLILVWSPPTLLVDPTERQRLEKLYDRTNPRQLRLQIYQWLDQLQTLPGARPGETENIFDTLLPAGQSKPELWICGQLSASSDLPTYPQLLRLDEAKNGKSSAESKDAVAR